MFCIKDHLSRPVRLRKFDSTIYKAKQILLNIFFSYSLCNSYSSISIIYLQVADWDDRMRTVKWADAMDPNTACARPAKKKVRHDCTTHFEFNFIQAYIFPE